MSLNAKSVEDAKLRLYPTSRRVYSPHLIFPDGTQEKIGLVTLGTLMIAYEKPEPDMIPETTHPEKGWWSAMPDYGYIAGPFDKRSQALFGLIILYCEANGIDDPETIAEKLVDDWTLDRT